MMRRDALIETSQVTISVGGYRVSLDENFDGNDTVMPSADYTFAQKIFIIIIPLMQKWEMEQRM